MSFYHLRSLAGTVWPPLPLPEISLLWAAYQELDRTQWLSAAELEHLQLQQLRTLVRHCSQQVPYYRRLLTEAGLAGRPFDTLDDLRRLPLLTRNLIQQHAADLEARALPAGMTPTGEMFTSGTNGVPIQVLRTTRTQLWWNALYLRDLEWCGLDPRGSIAVIRLLAKKPDLPRLLEGTAAGNWIDFLPYITANGPSYAMDIRQDPRRQLTWLRRIKPNYLLSFPSNLEFLAGLVQASGQPLPDLRAIQTIGETLTDAMRQRIEAGFGVPVKDTYSTTEAGYMASPCPQGHGLHVHAENILAEVLDEQDRPCAPGQTGRLVFTALHNFRAPLLRCDILDEVTLAPGPCPCGRGLPLWTRVEGRRHPLMHLANGKRKAISALYAIVRLVGGSLQFQIVQRAVEHVIVRVVPDATWTPAHAERIRAAVRDEVEAPIRVDVEEKAVLERPPGGKLKIGIVELDEHPA